MRNTEAPFLTAGSRHPGTQALTNQLPRLLVKKKKCQRPKHTLIFLAENKQTKKQALLFHLNQRETKPVMKFACWDLRALRGIGHVGNVEAELGRVLRGLHANNERLPRALKHTCGEPRISLPAKPGPNEGQVTADECDHTALALVKSGIMTKPGMNESTDKEIYLSRSWKE